MSRNLTRLARTMIAVLAFTSAVLCYGASDLPYIDVTALGAKNDAVQLKACSTVAGSTALACNGPYGKGFTAASMGKTIVVRGAGATLAPYSPLITTIAAFVDANHVTLAAAAMQTVRGTSAIFGTDNAAAFCAATQCTQAVYTGLYASGPLTGRELYIPGGSYLTSLPLYCRAGMTCIGAGQADTQIELATVQNNLTQTLGSVNWNTTSITPVICLGNATSGSGTCTPDNVDAGATGASAVYDMLEDSVGSITAGVLATSVTQTNGGNAYPSSAFYLHNLWPETYYGIVSWQTAIGDIAGYQTDFGTFGILLYGAGLSTSANSIPWGWNIHDSQLDGIQTPVIIDGMGDVLIANNVCGFTTASCIYINSSSGKTAYRISIQGNMFNDSGSLHGPTAAYIDFDGPCVNCSVLNNTFTYASANDILFTVNASGSTGLLISNNSFSFGQHDSGASIQAISTTSGEVTISNNKWDTPGYYAVFSANMNVKLFNNICVNPFTVFPPLTTGGGLEDQSACFYFTGANPSTVEARNNSVTSSGTPCLGTAKCPAVGFHAPLGSGPVTGFSSSNRSDYTTAVALNASASGTHTSFDEVVTNYGSSGAAAFKPFYSVGGLQDGANGAASTLACYKADGKTLGHCTAYTGGTTCTCGP